MNRIDKIGDVHVVVFENYRGRVPLLEHKCGTPLNPSGPDLWVLCIDEDRAEAVLRYAQLGINEYVTSKRANTFEAEIAALPGEAAIMFSTSPGDDNALMCHLYPDVAALGQKFLWKRGTYYLSAITADAGRYFTRETRIGRSDGDFASFRDAVARASRRLHKRAPVPFADDKDVQVVSAATSTLIGALGKPGACALRHWLDMKGEGQNGRWFSLPQTAFSPEAVRGIRSVTFEYGHPRIKTRILYQDGSVLDDLGLRLSQMLPDTAAHGCVGLDVDRVVDASALGPWPIHEIDQAPSGTFLGLRIPTAPIGPLQEREGLDPFAAERLLSDVLRQDLRENPVAGPLIRERDRAIWHLADLPRPLRGGIDVMATLTALGPETSVFVLSSLLLKEHTTSVDLTPWMGQGKIERRLDELFVSGGETIELASTTLVQGDTPK